MRTKILFAATAMCATLALAGCGSSATPVLPPAAKHVKPKAVATKVSAPLLSFSLYVDPLLKQSILTAQDVMTKMKSPDFSVLGDQCAASGGALANEQTPFQSSNPPANAWQTYSIALKAMKLAQSATDECATAADASSKKSLKTASRDLQTAIGQLSWAEWNTAKWQTGSA